MRALFPVVLAFILCGFGCGGPSSQTDAALGEDARALSNRVELREAVASWNSTGRSLEFATRLRGVVEVEDLGFEKQVVVHYRVRTRSYDIQKWTTVQARWVKDQLWEFETPDYLSNCPHYCTELHFQFAIAYSVGGATYWDNNGGWDYTLSTDVPPAPGGVDAPLAILRGADVKLVSSALGTDGRWQTDVVLKNLAYEKQVALVYSTDGWQTVHEANAAFSRTNVGGLEVWRSTTALPAQTPQVEFAIRYVVDGQARWDNNLGRNHVARAP